MADLIPDTQRAAYNGSKLFASNLQEQLYDALKLFPEGLTADEAAALIDEPILNCRPQMTNLTNNGRIVDSGLRRPNAVSGRNARVMIVA